MKIIETSKPKTVRSWIAMKLVRLAQWVYPDSEAVKAFYMQLIHDEMIYGRSVVRVEPKQYTMEKFKADHAKDYIDIQGLYEKGKQ